MRYLKQALCAKLTSDRGETLVETLVSTLIVVGVFMMLCTAIVSAARVTTAVTPEDVLFQENNAKSASVTLVISDQGKNEKKRVESDAELSPISGKVQNGYVFYDYKR